MIKIKVSNPFSVPLDTPETSLFRQSPGNKGIWEDCQFFLNQDIEECDFWIVFDHLNRDETTKCPPQNTILFTLEPGSIKTYSKRFLSQFATIVSCHKNLPHPHVISALTTTFWFPHKSFDELRKMEVPKKTKLISLIASDKTHTDGHRKRLEFALKLKERFGDQIDLFGRGINGFEDKWDVLAPYKFSLAIENECADDWITEKLSDCFLAYTFPLYYGCPNVDTYYDREALQIIDIDDFEKTCDVINSLLGNPTFYEDHLDALRKARTTYLEKYNFFPTAVDLIHSGRLGSVEEKVAMTLEKESTSISGTLRKIQFILKNRPKRLAGKILHKRRTKANLR